MSLSSHIRSHGVGRPILDMIEEFCRSRGYNRIILSTADFLKPALAVYHSNGYRFVKKEPYGALSNDQVNVRHLAKEMYLNN